MPTKVVALYVVGAACVVFGLVDMVKGNALGAGFGVLIGSVCLVSVTMRQRKMQEQK
jgi:hypothetical protein